MRRRLVLPCYRVFFRKEFLQLGSRFSGPSTAFFDDEISICPSSLFQRHGGSFFPFHVALACSRECSPPFPFFNFSFFPAANVPPREESLLFTSSFELGFWLIISPPYLLPRPFQDMGIYRFFRGEGFPPNETNAFLAILSLFRSAGASGYSPPPPLPPQMRPWKPSAQIFDPRCLPRAGWPVRYEYCHGVRRTGPSYFHKGFSYTLSFAGAYALLSQPWYTAFF